MEGRLPELCSLSTDSWCASVSSIERLLLEGKAEEVLALAKKPHEVCTATSSHACLMTLRYFEQRARLESQSLSYGGGGEAARSAHREFLVLEQALRENQDRGSGGEPLVPVVALQLARAELALGKGQAALERLSVLGKAFQNEAEVQAAWGIALLAVGRADESLAPLRRAALLDPQEPERRLVLASAQMLVGDTESAGRSYRTALALDGNSDRAHGGLGALLLVVGELNEGHAHLLRAARLAPEKATYWASLAYAELLLERPGECKNRAEESLRLDPELASAWLNLGLCEVALGRFDAAKSAFLRAQELAPDDPRPRNNLGDLAELEAAAQP